MAKEPEQIRSVEAIFTPSETDHMIRCVELAMKSYNRSQNQRPEFAETAKRIYNELLALRQKIMGIHSLHKV